MNEDGTKTITQTDVENHTSEALTYSRNNLLLKKVTYTLNEPGKPRSGVGI